VAAQRHLSVSLGDRVGGFSSLHAPMGITVPTEGQHCCSLTCAAGHSAKQARAVTVVLAAAAALWWVVLQGPTRARYRPSILPPYRRARQRLAVPPV
jgi:hypothetical protein